MVIIAIGVLCWLALGVLVLAAARAAALGEQPAPLREARRTGAHRPGR